MNNLVMHLRKACNHPYLLYPDYNPPHPLDTVDAAGKFVLLDHILPKLRRAGECRELAGSYKLDAPKREVGGSSRLRLAPATRCGCFLGLKTGMEMRSPVQVQS